MPPQFTPESNFEISPFAQPFDFEGQRGRFGLGDDILGRFRSTISGFEQLPESAARIGQELQIPGQRENVLRLGELTSGLQNQLRALPGQVAGRSRESLVTAPQQQRIIQSEGQPIAENLGVLAGVQELAGARLGQSEQQLGQRLGLLGAQQERQLLPFEFEFNAEEQSQAREFSGYTFENQLELNRLISNQQAGLTWTNAESQRANALAIAEKGYENHLAGIRESGSQTRETSKFNQSLASFGSDPFFNNLFGF